MDGNRYKLPDHEHERAFQRIRTKFTTHSTPSDNPTAIITGGQPGAGKSGLTYMAKQELASQGGYVLIDADSLRPFHKNYADLLAQNDTSAADLTHHDAAAWASRLRRYAMEQKHNLIIDQTSRDPAALVRLSNQLHDHGYNVDLRVMAVNSEVSEQRINKRYESQKAIDGFGRFSNVDNHNLAYQTLPTSLDAVQNGSNVDSIKLYDQNHNQIYDNRLINGRWSNEISAAQALTDERNRPMSLDDKRIFADDYADILKLIKAPGRAAANDEVEKIEERTTKARLSYYADVIRQLPENKAVKLHPELSPAYDLMNAIKTNSRGGLSTDQQSVVDGRIKQNVADQIEQGNISFTQGRAVDTGKGPER